MRKKKFRLSEMNIDSVSLVSAGDDPLAKTVIAKAQTEDSHGEEDMAKLDKDDLPDEIVEYIDTLEDELRKHLAREQENVNKDDDDEEVETDEDEDDASSDDVDTGDEDDDDEEVEEGDVKKALVKADPQVRAVIRKMAKDNASLQKNQKKLESRITKAEKVAKDERDERRRRDYLEVAKGLPMISDKPDELAELLKTLNDTDEESANKVLAILKASNAQVSKSNIFEELGRPGGMVTMSDEVESKVADIRKSDPKLTREEAMDQVLQLNPELYETMVEEG